MIWFFQKAGIKRLLWAVLIAIALAVSAEAQQGNDMTGKIQALKKDSKGPFQAIKWFCPDGGVLPAKERCQSPGGLQHGILKEWISTLAQDKKIYLDMILAGSSHEMIWDASNRYSRIKQYILGQYLFLADDGWIYRNARYYRGAIQAEDESDWGDGFLKWLLADQDAIHRQFFLVREAFRVLPRHDRDKNLIQVTRAVSKTLSDQIPAFMDIRVKIHGRPDPEDLLKVRAFMEKYKKSIDESQITLFSKLVENLEAVYSLSAAENLGKLMTGSISQVPELSKSIKNLEKSLKLINEKKHVFNDSGTNPYKDMADLLFNIRSIISLVQPGVRPVLMDFSLGLEKALFSFILNWEPVTLAGLIEKIQVLVKAAAGCGYLEMWEWTAAISNGLEDMAPLADAGQFQLKAEQIRRMVDWGTLMVRAAYLPETELFFQFEPMAQGFIDDRIRSSVLLPLGEAAGRLTRFVQTAVGVSHRLPDGIKPHGVRGLNPGFAYGGLEVVTKESEKLSVDSKKIYAFKTIPAELKPVAGILSVSEGNLVSHVQLLARNLGIPNAVISSENLDHLVSCSGQRVLYAVSQKGTVVLKQEGMLTDAERILVQGKKRNLDKFRVPVEKINLEKKHLIPLGQVRAIDSGRICGPKAANLGQLKFLFPDYVSEGIVIPFGIFREHMDQIIPGRNISYWQFLTKALSDPLIRETQLIETLAGLQSVIRTMPFLSGFESALAGMFNTALNDEIGNVPVFIRSDTNMEDIQNFTGAGLNLTVFNVRDKGKIFQGIRDVWASPYSERSYLWRQKYLENPENVFPSILLLPSVNVDKSGVVITHGIVSNNPKDITAAFNRGVGGAVEGQAAETYLLRESGMDILMYPARETLYASLPVTGGIEKQYSFFDQPVLTDQDRLKIRDLVKTVRRVLPGTPGIEGQGPFDIELGFINGKMRLFQARPFVENKRAAALNYLLTLDQDVSVSRTLSNEQAVEP